jgi:tRNA pseudouridine65 synthase
MISLTEADICYIDDYLVAISKPHGLLVHRTSIAADEDVFALQLVRDLVGRTVYPVHRIDRKTYGVLLFAFAPETVRELKLAWESQSVTKCYQAYVRGWVHGDDTITHTIKNHAGKKLSATSSYKAVQHYEIDLPHRDHKTSRYSLVHLSPITGKTHQLRQLMNHLRHPILGDRPHGCNKQNRLWLQHYQLSTMMLWAESLSFTHPAINEDIHISCGPSQDWQRVTDILGPPTKAIP